MYSVKWRRKLPFLRHQQVYIAKYVAFKIYSTFLIKWKYERTF